MPVVLEDPASLRYVAQRLRVEADEICAATARVHAATAGFVYEGPAAARFFETTARSHSVVHAEAQQLYGLAGRLDALALDAEARIQASAGLP